jgi:hypothetical protein
MVPVTGIALSVAAPLARYAERQRQERAAIAALTALHVEQERFKDRNGGFATDLASLTTPCPGTSGSLNSEVLAEFAAAGYVAEMRIGRGAPVTGRDCHGRPVAADYYVTASPLSAKQPAQAAFAGRAGGRFYQFFDGIPPREADIAAGLAVDVADRGVFKIP